MREIEGAERGIFFPALALAARRLHLDRATEAAIAEGVLGLLDADFEEREAVRMSIIDELRRRGAYHGQIRRAVESGVIFQMREDGNGGGGAPGRLGKKLLRKTTVAPPPVGKRFGADDA